MASDLHHFIRSLERSNSYTRRRVGRNEPVSAYGNLDTPKEEFPSGGPEFRRNDRLDRSHDTYYSRKGSNFRPTRNRGGFRHLVSTVQRGTSLS